MARKLLVLLFALTLCGCGSWTLSGYASTSHSDGTTVRISRSMLQRSAKDLQRRTTVLFNHDSSKPIGRISSVCCDNNGLYVEIVISKTCPDVWRKILDKTLWAFSIGFNVTDWSDEWDPKTKQRIRVAIAGEISEVSIVSVPANIHARITRVGRREQ